MGGLVRYRADATHPPARVSNHEGRHNDTSKREGRLTDRAPQDDRVVGHQNTGGGVKITGGGVKTTERFMGFRGRDALSKARAHGISRQRRALQRASRARNARGTRPAFESASRPKALVSIPGCHLEKKTGRKTMIVYPRHVPS